MSPRRALVGGRVDRTRQIRFTFDGRRFVGHPGDTLASALMASGVSLMGRSFKYHRPRGVFSAGMEEPNALVTILKDGAREPNIPATTIEIFDGLMAESQNRFPTLALDIGAANQLAGPVFAAGFYYKTFMGPVIGPLRGTRFWMFCEWFIRRAAGLGKAGYEADPARYERMNAFCDVLVVGAGPAGLMAAKTATEAGKRVILAEQEAEFGGSARWSGETIGTQEASSWAAETVTELAAMPNVRLLPRTSVWGYYDGNTLAAVERVSDHKAKASPGEPRHRHWTIRASAVVLATGAFERPLVFPGNDRPGVMLAGAAERYAVEYGVLPGDRVALFTNNDGAYRAVLALERAGADIAAIIDVRPDISPAARALAEKAGADVLTGHAVVSTRGARAISQITVQPFDAASGTLSGTTRTIDLDCLAVSGGWSPAIHLASQAGAAPKWDERLQAFLPPEPAQKWQGAGAFTGAFTTQEAIVEGIAAGAAAAGAPPRAKRRRRWRLPFSTSRRRQSLR